MHCATPGSIFRKKQDGTSWSPAVWLPEVISAVATATALTTGAGEGRREEGTGVHSLTLRGRAAQQVH